MTTPRIDTPILYEMDLGENSTRFERMRAWSEPDEMRLRFSISTGINAAVAVSCAVMVLGIITSKKILSSPFNWYLLFISIPDFFAAFFCFWTCVLSIEKGEYYGEIMCGFQSFYLTWAFTTNSWLNARIVYEIHKLLRFSNRRRRYIPPTRQDVIMQAMGVYLYSAVWGILAGFNFVGFPMESGLHGGFSCYPIDTKGSIWFTLGVYIPLTILIPSVYAVAAMLHVWKKKLMPPEGRRRKIAMFLLRVIFVYLFIWGPFLVIYFLLYAVDLSPWFQFSVSMGSHFQGMITAVVCYHTDDDLKASMNKIMAFRCCCGNGSLGEDFGPFSLSSRFSKRFSKRMSIRASLFGRKRNGDDHSAPIEAQKASANINAVSSSERAISNITTISSMRESTTPDEEALVEDDGDDADDEMSLQQALDEEQERWNRESELRASELIMESQVHDA